MEILNFVINIYSIHIKESKMGRSNNQRRERSKRLNLPYVPKKCKSKWKKLAAQQMQKRDASKYVKSGYYKDKTGKTKKKRYY